MLLKELFLFLLFSFLLSISAISQFTSLEDVQGLPSGTYSFDFGDGPFDGYIDEDGWLLWLQYHHAANTGPALNIIGAGNDLPIYDSSPLGTDLSGDLTKWGHGSQDLAISIPDSDLWLRWEASTSNHSRKIHFESPVLGKFLSTNNDLFTPDIRTQNIHRADHSSFLPESATDASKNVAGDKTLTSGPFWAFNNHSWEISGGNGRWNVDNVRNADGTLIQNEHSTLHRVWVRPLQFNSTDFLGSLNQLQDHINNVAPLTEAELIQIRNLINIYAQNLAADITLINKSFDIIDDFDQEIGPLFTTPSTQNGFQKDVDDSPGLGVERAVLALQQALFDYFFTADNYTLYPALITNRKYESCVSFPGAIAPPADPTETDIIPIRADFKDPWGINPSFNMNGDGEEHALRPTGQYLAPGSIVTITVPPALVNNGYYIRVGAHEWNLDNRPFFKRLDRITKKFEITETTIQVFNPLGGAIAVLVPYLADDGIVDITIENAVDAPFFSIKDFYETIDFEAELSKPAPWAVFETDNIMYTIPSHSIVPGAFNLRATLEEWDLSLEGINYVLAREINSDKHDLYMITDVTIRGGAYSIGYPQSNNPINYASVPGPVNFIDGVSEKYHVNYHEYGHSVRISKYQGEGEAAVNFPFIAATNYGLGRDFEESVQGSFVPHTFNIDRTITHRTVSNSFGGVRDITNSTTNEVRYQHRGYGHYFEIVNLFGWCALRNFWVDEFNEFENGNDLGINNQDNDGRILRFSSAAKADLRPLFHVFGILPQDPASLQNDLVANDIQPSIVVYDRLQEYLQLIPADNAAFIDYALLVYPNLMTAGPTSNPDFGVGWHYQKSLTYNAAEASTRINLLTDIINTYFPTGQPSGATEIICCNDTELCDGVDNNGDGVIDEHQVNTWVGPTNTYWHDSEENWSLCKIPNSCNTVVIDGTQIVKIETGKVAEVYSVNIGPDAQLVAETGSELIVYKQD